jgi:phosphohistidine phosphatase
MKRLTILRHAKSDWDDPNLEDFNRPLNDRGWKAARRMGREIKHRDFKFDLILCSTAARARETLDGIREKAELDAEIRFEPRMYAASEDTLLSIVHALEESVRAPLLVGHNPGLERLIADLTHDDRHDLRDRIVHKFPTCALARLELRAHRWADVEPSHGEVVELILPKELD